MSRHYAINAKFIRLYLEKNEMTRETLAHSLDISAQSAQTILNGDPQRKVVVMALAHWMRVTLSEVLAPTPRLKKATH